MDPLDPNPKDTRGHQAKLIKVRCESDIKKYFFSHRVVNRWNALNWEIISYDGVIAFKSRLAKIRETQIGFFVD